MWEPPGGQTFYNAIPQVSRPVKSKFVSANYTVSSLCNLKVG